MKDVLVVDDELGMRSALEASFLRQGWNVRTAGGKNEAIALFRSDPVPFVVTDMRMGDGTGLEVIQGLREIDPDTVIVVLTAFANVSDAVTAMKNGAFDYLIKPVSFDQLSAVAERALRRITEAPGPGPEHSRPIVQGSGSFRAVLERARQIARTEVDVLVEAESGTGKEVLARFIHRFSRRSAGPFVAVNCASFPESLLESELFGHVRGAFTGATTTKPGKFELANGGTLLLDEIGEMPMTLQPKILRVLQEREVDRLGDVRPLKIDVRVIATTNQPLRTRIQDGKFRLDLYYRLNVVPLLIPPLREHPDDIPELVGHFLAKYASPISGTPVRFSTELMDRLQHYSWPGNIRELENFVRRALALSVSPVAGTEVLDGVEFPESTTSSPNVLEAGLTMREAERQLYQRTLEATDGNRTRAAEMLGVSLRTVRNKIREYGFPARGQEVGCEHVG